MSELGLRDLKIKGINPENPKISKSRNLTRNERYRRLFHQASDHEKDKNEINLDVPDTVFLSAYEVKC